MQERHGLGEIDDVNAVASPVDEGFHLRIPTVGLVTEMDACFQELADGEFWHSHSLLLRLIRRGLLRPVSRPPDGEAPCGELPLPCAPPLPACEVERHAYRDTPSGVQGLAARQRPRSKPS